MFPTQHEPPVRVKASRFEKILVWVPGFALWPTLILLFVGVVPDNAMQHAIRSTGLTWFQPIGAAMDHFLAQFSGLVSTPAPQVSRWFGSIPTDVVMVAYVGGLAVATLALALELLLGLRRYLREDRDRMLRDTISW